MISLQILHRITLATLVVAASAFCSSTSVAQSNPYASDGEWAGEMQTTFSSGPCGTRYRLEISVKEGAATGSATRPGERFTLYGEVDAGGRLTWSATSGRGSATGEGLVDGETARGDWEDSTGRCTGTFSIDRKS